MKSVMVIILSVLIVAFVTTGSEAGWLVYYKPVFSGKVIDAETKEPIEGAVAVAVYSKSTMGLGAGSLSSTINVREALTDKNGIFTIPSYITMIQPFSWESTVSFIIFKSGYGSFPNMRKYPPRGMSLPNQEIYFSERIGAEKSFYDSFAPDWKLEFRKLKTGIVELPKVTTKGERRKSLDGANIKAIVESEGINLNRMLNLYKFINEERQYLGFEPYDKE
jgi:hypothetical protein